MKITVGELRAIIKKGIVNEIGGPRGGLRSSHRGGRQQYKIGKVADENRELSFSEAEMIFPGSTGAWAEIVPSEFPDFPFADDPIVVKRRSVFFDEGGILTVAFADMPQITLATWHPEKGAGEGDWILTGDMQEAINRRRFIKRLNEVINASEDMNFS